MTTRSSLYEQALTRISRNKELKDSGEYLGIPYPYQRLNEYITTIDRGQAIGILGPTGSGKSKFCRYTFLYHVYKFYKETGYKLRILYFCMEDAKDSTFDFVLCNYLYEYHNIHITRKELNSKTRSLPDFVIEALKEAANYFSEFEKIVTFIDGVSEPTPMYNMCKDIALKMGNVEDWVEEIEGKKIKQYSYHCDTHVIAVFDNMSNIDGEQGSRDEQEAILKFVKDYMRLKLCNFFKWTCVMVMQMDFESERQSFTRSGETIVSKLEPTLASVGDSKRSTRSMHLIFSLFAPARHELMVYPIPPKDDTSNCYRIDILGNRFRSLRVIKSNDSDTGMRVGLFFDAVAETYTELPLPKTPELEEVYKKLTNKPYTKIEKRPETINFEEPEDFF